MKTLVLVWLISLASFGSTNSANPTMRCLIAAKSVKSALKQSAAVFSGEVIEVKNGRHFMEARFRVERSWKGVDAEEVLVLVDSTVESPHYRASEKYLVFAGIQYGKLFTGNCSRTRKIADAQEDLKQLGEGKAVKP
jgi:hypothetical protein